MSTLTISISDELARRLREMSEQTGVRPEDLASADLEEWILIRPREDFQKIAQYILKKNEELYRRLA